MTAAAYRVTSGVGRRAVQPWEGNGLAGSAAIWEGSVGDVEESTTRSVTDTICSEPGTSPGRTSLCTCFRSDACVAALGLPCVGRRTNSDEGNSDDAVSSDVPERIEPARDWDEHDWHPRPLCTGPQ